MFQNYSLVNVYSGLFNDRSSVIRARIRVVFGTEAMVEFVQSNKGTAKDNFNTTGVDNTAFVNIDQLEPIPGISYNDENWYAFLFNFG